MRRLNEFTTVHEGWLVSLDVLSADLGIQHDLHDVPLLGVSADRIDHDGTITISVARSSREHATHVIGAAARVWIERTDEGADAALQIESMDGTRTILRFRAPALSETVDGIVGVR